jgi:type I restriction enzyme S subunit
MTAISGKPDADLDILPTDQFAPLAATAALFPDELENSGLGEIPKGWHPSTLGEQCAYLNRGISPKYIDEGGVLVLNQKCIRDFSVDPSKGRRHDPSQRNVSGRDLQQGDVLVNSTGVGTLGRVAQVLRLDEPTIVDSHVTVVRTGANLNSAYLGQWFVMKQPDIEAMGEGSTGQTELSRGKLATMPILVPDPAVLRAFAAAVAPMQSLMSTRDRESLGLQETRDALLPRLLSGELRPSGALEGVDA